MGRSAFLSALKIVLIFLGHYFYNRKLCNLLLSKVSSVQRRQPQRRGRRVGAYFLALGLGASDTLVTSTLRG